MAITATPDPWGNPKTYITAIDNYDGAGGDFILICDVFRSVVSSIPGFPADQCGPTGLSPNTKDTLVSTSTRRPMIAIVSTPPDDPEPVNGAAPNGSNVTYDFVFWGNQFGGLQGLTCAVPSTLKELCVSNLRLFLATSAETRQLSLPSDDAVVAKVSAIIGA